MPPLKPVYYTAKRIKKEAFFPEEALEIFLDKCSGFV